MRTPYYDHLAKEIAGALSSHYGQWVTDHPADDVYAYVLYATPLVSRIAVSVLTEQGLKQVAQVYKNKYRYPESLQQLERRLRWSVADSPYCSHHHNAFDYVNTRLEAMMLYVHSIHVDDPEFVTHFDTIHSILVDALNQVRRRVLHDKPRPMLYVDFGDMSDDERLSFIVRCNTPEVVAEYLRSVEAAAEN